MSGRSVTRLPFYLFAPLCGISLFAACSSDTTNYFDTPNPAAGKSAAGTGGSAAAAGGSNSDSGGAGGSKAGTGSEAGGSGGDKPSKGGTGNGGSSNPTGGTPNVGGLGGNTPNQGGTGNGGSTEGGMSGESGAGETGAGGTTGGTGGTQSPGGEGGMQGGMAGDPGGGGTGGAHVGGTGGTGAGTGGQPDACDADDDCATSEYCKKSSCDAAKGTCTEKPASCTGTSAALNPVCGCDHMTYYTACVAAQEGVNVASSGACGSGAATCNRIDGGSSCSPERARAACYRTRSTNSCNTGSPPNEGVCWVLPETCPTEETLELDCNNGGTPICRGLCDALEKNRPLIRNSNQCD